LERKRVLGSLRLGPGNRRGYEAYMESRVLELGLKAGRAGLEEKWKALRRGWYVGAPTFLEKLEDWLVRAGQGQQRASHSGAAREAHDAAAAERLLGQGLAALQLTAAGLAQLPKGAPEKAALAWWLRGRTTVSLRWVSERLGMGHYTRVTQAVGRANRKPARKLLRLKETLLALNASDKKNRA
jgi:hypothetical protein